VKIVIDTNALHQDYLLEATALVSLTKARERAGCSLFVPAVVVTEHAKHFRDARRVAASQLRQAARDVAALFGRPVETPDLNAVRDDCEERIRRRLEELGIGVLDHPKVSHEALATRAVSRQPPFSKDGRGYQDTLVWFSLLELLPSDEPVVLVSNDGIFGEKDLAPELQVEVDATGHKAGVFLAKTLSIAFEKHVEPTLQRLDRLEKSLANGTSRLNLAQWLSQNLLNVLRDHDARESANKNAKPSFEWLEVEKPKFAVVRAHAVSDQDAYVRVKVEADGHIGGWEWFMIAPDDMERDWVDSAVTAKVELELLISGEENVSRYTVLSLSPTGVPEAREPDEFDGDFEDDD
jgi:hypothetical protein